MDVSSHQTISLSSFHFFFPYDRIEQLEKFVLWVLSGSIELV